MLMSLFDSESSISLSMSFPSLQYVLAKMFCFMKVYFYFVTGNFYSCTETVCCGMCQSQHVLVGSSIHVHSFLEYSTFLMLCPLVHGSAWLSYRQSMTLATSVKICNSTRMLFKRSQSGSIMRFILNQAAKF